MPRAPKAAPTPAADKKAAPAAKSAPQKALEKLNLRRDIDLALHLPLRYEDETRIVKLAEAREATRRRSRARSQPVRWPTARAASCW